MPYTQPNDGTATYDAQEQGFGQEIEEIAAAAGVVPRKSVLNGAEVTDGTTGLQVDVAEGWIWYGGKPYYEAGTTLTCSTADGTNPRVDYVVYDWGTTSFVIRAGTAAPAPVPPAVATDEVLLAEVYVPAGATTLAAANIIDKRMTSPTPLDTGTFYVDTDNGTDLGGTWAGRGRTWELAFATMSAANTAATAGDTIYVRGTYSAFTITKHLTIIGTDAANWAGRSRSAAAARTLSWRDGVLKVTGAVTITLPDADDYEGKNYFIQRVSASNSVTIQPGTFDIVKDGTTYTGTAVLASDGAAIGLYSDGTDWIVAGDRGTVTYT